MVMGYCTTSHHDFLILIQAKDPIPACVATSPARSFYYYPAHCGTDHWPLATSH
jgi:hypothetical protein